MKVGVVPLVLWSLGMLWLIPTLLLSVISRFRSYPKAGRSGRTVLLTGAKMTKCLQLARMFQAAGDRVIVAETPLYRWCGTRFSNAISKFYIISDIEGQGEGYCEDLIALAERENVDLFVPVATPKSAYFDALAKPGFPKNTEVFHFDLDLVDILDDKHRFIGIAKAFGLSVPESHLFENKQELLRFDFNSDKRYVLKKIAYDPVYRLDLRTLPHAGWQDRVMALPIDSDNRWVLQEFIEGDEVCTHTTSRWGELNLYICSASSPFQVNYEMLHLPKVKEWVRSFVKSLGATGQISFDFILKENGTVIPIECNPRTHSAITLLHDHKRAIAAYRKSERSTDYFEPGKNSGHTYWWYHELYRLLTCRNLSSAKMLIIRMFTGKEAVFQWYDPWPFWFNNHISIPYQIIKKFRKGALWTRIDFNIGKIIVPGGD